MAPSFKIEAKLAITGPANVKPVVDSLRRQLGNVNIPIRVKFDPKAIQGITVLNKKLHDLDVGLKHVTASSNSLNASLHRLSSSFQQLGKIKQGVREIQKAEQEIVKIRTASKTSATEIERFGQSAAFAIRRFSAFTVAVGAVFGFVRALQTATSEAIDFEKQLTKIAQVQGGRANIRSLSDEITKLSTTLGVSSKDLADVAQTLAQAGFSASDTKKALAALAKTALAPTFNDIKNTTEAAIAAMSQFSLEAKDLESVLGSINSVAAAFAAESEDLTTVIRRAGAVFATAGSQLDDPKKQLNELLALFTSVRSTTRESADTIATGFRTIFSRLQRTDTLEYLRNFNIELTDTEGRFVGVFEAVRRLNAGLSHFHAGDTEFAEIIKQLAGRGEQVSKVIPLIQQFPKALEALNVANKGSSSLTKDQILAQETLANSIARVREEFLALIREVTQTESFRVLTKSILGVASSLIKVADTLKPILPLLTALASVKLASSGLQFLRGFSGELHFGGKGPLKRASGGPVPGSGDSDSVLSLLTPGEYVIPKSAASKLGPRVLGQIAKFAKGGPVGGGASGGGGSLIIGPDLDSLAYDVKAAAKAIEEFTRGLSHATQKTRESVLKSSPEAVALSGGTHTSRLASFPLAPVVDRPGLSGLSAFGSPIAEKARVVSRQKLRTLGGTPKGGSFVGTIGGVDDEYKLASDTIPFDEPSGIPTTNKIKYFPRTNVRYPTTREAYKVQRFSNNKYEDRVAKTSFNVGNNPTTPATKVVNPLFGDSDSVRRAISNERKKRRDPFGTRTTDLAKLMNHPLSETIVSDLRNKAELKAIAGPLPESVVPSKPAGPSLARRAGLRVRAIAGRIKGNVTSQTGINALGAGAFLAAGQLEGTGRVGSSVASGLTGGLAAGTLTAGLAGGPAGAVVGVTTGIIAGLDRFLSETNRLAKEVEETKFGNVLDRLAESIKKGTGNVDALISEGRGSIKRETELETSSGRSLNTLVGTGLGHLADFVTGGQTIGGDSHADIGRSQGATGLVFEEIANLFGTQNRGNSKFDAEQQKRELDRLQQLANPQFEAIKKKIVGGASLGTVGISKEQRQLFTDAGKDFSELINADKIRQSQEALAKLVGNIEVLASKFDKLTAATEADISVMDRFAKVQDDIGNIFSGSGRVTSSGSRASMVLGNIEGFGNHDIEHALTTTGVDARTSSIISSGRRALQQAPGIFEGINVAGDPAAAKAQLSKGIQNLHLDKAIEDSILHDIRELDVSGQGETEFREKFRELAENLPQNVGKLLDPAIKSAQALAKKQETAANLYIDSLNRLADAQVRFRDSVFEGADTKLEARRAIASAEGRDLTPSEARSALTAKTATLGINNPTGLGARISELRGRSAGLTESRASLVPGTAEFKRNVEQQQKVNDELDKAQKALELFSKDTTLASIAADKLQKVDAKRAVGREIASGILGNDRLGFAKKANALSRFQQGDLRTLFTSFEDVQAGIELQTKFLRANGRGKDADAVEANFDKGIGAVLGPEFAKYFKTIREEEVKAKADQIAAAKLQITAAEESIKASRAAMDFFGGRVGAKPGRAGGGMIRGRGTSTSDSITARLSDGEYVLKADAVNKIGVDNLDYMNEVGELPGYAYGGRVRSHARGIIKSGTFNFPVAGGRPLIRRGNRVGFVGATGKFRSPYTLARSDLNRNYYAAKAARKAAYTSGLSARRKAYTAGRRRKFATGGLVQGGDGGLGDVSGFVAAANNLASALSNINIPSSISMQGTHEVHVTLNGASVLSELLNGPLSNLIRSEVSKAFSKYDQSLKS